MYFNSDLIIKGDTAKKMIEIKNQYSFTFIDIFIYCVLLGIDSKTNVSNYNDSDETGEEIVNIPRNVLINNIDLINNISAIAVIKKYEGKLSDDILRLAFEDKDEDYKTFEKFKCSLSYANAGVSIFYTMLNPKDGVIRDEITILNGILDKYKGV